MLEARWILCIVQTIVFHWNSIAANKIAHFTIDESLHWKWQILMCYIAKFLPYPNIPYAKYEKAKKHGMLLLLY